MPMYLHNLYPLFGGGEFPTQNDPCKLSDFLLACYTRPDVFSFLRISILLFLNLILFYPISLYSILSYLISVYLATVGISGIVSAFLLSFSLHYLFLCFFLSFFSVSWVGEQSQEWWSEMLALIQCWYAVTAVEAGRGRSWTQRETQDWLIETGVRTRDQTLTLPRETVSASVTSCPHPLYCCISLFSFVLELATQLVLTLLVLGSDMSVSLSSFIHFL